MKIRPARIAAIACAGLAVAALQVSQTFAQTTAPTAAPPAASKPAPTRSPDVVFVPTPQEVVDEMLKVAGVGPNDVLYDLGSGDGRIPITAAQRFGTRGMGFDIDPQRIREANENAQRAGMTDKVTFVHGDIFELSPQELGKATVISLYLLPELNLKLRPTLWQLKPGTRIVSHAFDMGDWKPEQELTVNGRRVFFWRVPERKPGN